MTREGKERTLRKAIDCLIEATSLLRSVANEKDALFECADAADLARQTTFKARHQAATALGLLVTHKH